MHQAALPQATSQNSHSEGAPRVKRGCTEGRVHESQALLDLIY